MSDHPAAQPAPLVGPVPAAAPPDALTAFWAHARPGASPARLAASAVVGLLGGVLLLDGTPGLGFALVALAGVGITVPAVLRRRRISDVLLLTWSALLLAVVALRAAPWLVALCILAGLAVGGVAVAGARTSAGVLLAPLTTAVGFVRALPWLARGGRDLAGRRGRGLARAVVSGGVALLLVVVFGALFAGADPVFARLIPRVDLNDLPARVIVGTLVGLLAATVLHVALAPPRWSAATLPGARPASLATWLVPVLALDAVVLAFLLVQVGTLIDGDAVTRATGLTYAEYARQGFGQLVVATALTLVVVGVAARYAPVGRPRGLLAARASLGLLCLGTLGVVASALRRMDLYVAEFGLTQLRVLATWGEVVMGVVLLLLVVAGLRWRGRWLPVAVVHVVAVAMLALALVNPDATIARHNLARSHGELDQTYLGELSADAVPALVQIGTPRALCVAAGIGVEEVTTLSEWNLTRVTAAQAQAGLPAGTCR